MIDSIGAAKRKREELLRQVAKLDQFIALGEELGLDAHEPSTSVTSVMVLSRERGRSIKPRPRRLLAAGDSKVAKTVEAARAALVDAGKPMFTAALLEAVIARGIEVGGLTPASTLSARLSVTNDLTNYKGVGWWPTNLARPDTNIR